MIYTQFGGEVKSIDNVWPAKFHGYKRRGEKTPPPHPHAAVTAFFPEEGKTVGLSDCCVWSYFRADGGAVEIDEALKTAGYKE